MNDFWRDREEVEFKILLLSIISVVNTYSDSFYNKLPCRISTISGEKYVESLIQQNHPRRIQEVFRMPLYTFLQLQIWIQDNTNLRSSKRISVPKKLAIFVETVGRGASNRAVQERFQHSGDTVSRCFHQVLDALVEMHAHNVKIRGEDYQTDARIMDDSKYAAYLGDCLGALDGTHIDAHIPYRNRKGTLSQNILAVVTFDLRYCYVLPGWEGSAHDSRILTDAVSNHGKYHLADAGYCNSDSVMIPYRAAVASTSC